MKKLIDLDPTLKKQLSIIAAHKETNLKHLIERILDDYVIRQTTPINFTQIRK